MMTKMMIILIWSKSDDLFDKDSRNLVDAVDDVCVEVKHQEHFYWSMMQCEMYPSVKILISLIFFY